MQAQHLSNLLDSPPFAPTHAIPPFYTWIQFRAKVTAATCRWLVFWVGVLALILAVSPSPRSALSTRGAGGSAGQIDQLDNRHAERLGGCGKAGKGVDSLQRSSQVAFDSIGPELGGLRDSVKKLEDAAKARVVAPKSAKGGEGAAATAVGPGEYKVKPVTPAPRLPKRRACPSRSLKRSILASTGGA